MLVKKRMWINLAGGFASILVLMIIIAYVGYNVMSNVIEKYNQGNQVNRMINMISTAREQEKNFIIYRDKKYVKRLKNAIAELKEEAMQAKFNFRNPDNKKYLDIILLSTIRYEQAFDAYVSRYDTITDAENKMNSNAQALLETAQSFEEELEKELAELKAKSDAKILDKLNKVEDANNIIEWTLECQVNEKQYIVAKDDKHVEQIDTQISDIIELAGDLKSRFTHKSNKLLADNLIESAEIYQAGFKQYVMLPWRGSELDMLEAAQDLIATSRIIRTMQHMELKQVQSDASVYMEKHMERAQNMHEVLNSILLCLRDGRNFIVFGSDQYILSVNGHVDNIIELTEMVSSQIKDTQRRKQLLNIVHLINAYKRAFDQSVELKRRHKEDITILTAEAHTTNDAFEQIHANQIILIEKQVSLGRNVLIVCTIMGLAFGAILAFLIIKQSTRVNNLLRNAKDQAESANQAKSEFLARMSHEIRTPLNAVTGLTNIVLRSELTTDQRDYLNKVKIASNNLLEVINDILDFSKIEADRMDLAIEPFNLDHVMEKLSDLFCTRVAQKDLELVFAVSPQVPRQLTGDAARLTQVLTNLVENAVKVTEAGEIVVKVELFEGSHPDSRLKTIKFQVSDTGIGVSADVLPTLFDPFIQAESYLTREHEGTGLGLAICRRLVELMGGRIWAKSIPGEGSIFNFTVLLESREEEKPELSAPPDLNGLKTLIVDDNATIRQVLTDQLESFTFNVTAVKSGEKAIEALEQTIYNEPFQIVLLDWKMPGMDGIETAKRIRKMDFNAHDKAVLHEKPSTKNYSTIPIIILVTAYGYKMVQKQIDRTAIDAMLLKPVKPSQLFNTIMELLGRNEAAVPRINIKKAPLLASLAGRRALLVEDSQLNRDVAVILLKEAGLNVEIAENGQVAIDKMTTSEKEFYHIVFMDIQMPVMDGYEATRQIRKWENQQGEDRIPIIALTAHALKGEKNNCLAADMDDYLSKPLDEEDLYRILLKWIAPGEKPADITDRIPTDCSLPHDQMGLDVEGALKRIGGRKHIYLKMLNNFLPECCKTYEIMSRYLDDGDTEAASRIAHTVKGVAATIGAADLRQVSEKLETTIRDNGPEIDDLLCVFKRTLDRTLKTVNDFIETESQEQKPSIPT